MLHYIGRAAFCLGFLAIASQASQDQQVNETISKIKQKSHEKKNDPNKQNEERRKENEKMKVKKEICDKAFQEKNEKLKKKWKKVEKEDRESYGHEKKGFNSEDAINKHNKASVKISDTKAEIEEEEAAAKEELIKCVKKATTKNGPVKHLKDAFDSLKESACKDINLIEPEANNFIFTKKNKWKLSLQNDLSYEKQVGKLKITIEEWQKSAPKLFYSFMKKQKISIKFEKDITTEFLKKEIEIHLKIKDSSTKESSSNEDKAELFLQRLNESWNQFYQRNKNLFEKAPFKPLEFYKSQNDLVNCSLEIDYNTKSRNIETHQVSSKRMETEGVNKFISHAKCNAKGGKADKEKAQKNLETCLETLKEKLATQK